jgi:hypothetical protein
MTSSDARNLSPFERLSAGWRKLPAALRRVLADGLLPLALMVVGTLWISGPVATSPHLVASRKLFSLQPIDYGATVWFYDWVARALTSDATILEPSAVCHPTGTTLGTNFPNWLDAILAAPLVGGLGFPTGYNLWLAAIPVLAGLAAYAALRCLTRHRSLALVGAWVFGFNGFSAYQAIMGRPSMALVAILPLFLFAWLAATSRRGWPGLLQALGAGVLAGMALHLYVLWALLCWIFGGLIWLARLISPPEHTQRRHLLLAALLALGAAGVTTAPYLYQATVLQPRFPAPGISAVPVAEDGAVPPWTAGSSSPVEQRLLAPWEPELWSFTLAFARDRLQHLGEHSEPAPGLRDESLQELARHALPLNFPWRGAEIRGDPAGLLPLAWLAPLVLLLAVLAGPRAWPWAALTLLLWSLTLGPWCMDAEGVRAAPMLVGGQRLRMPLWFVVQAMPEAGSFLKPGRLFPGFLLAMVVTMTVAMDQLSARTRPWLERLWAPAARLAWPALAVVILLTSGWAQARLVGQLDDSVSLEPYPYPFHQRLAEQADGTAIIELPMGLGQALAGFQPLHGRARADDHHDAIAAQKLGEPPPPDCYRLVLLHTLWDLGRTGGHDGPIEPRELTQAHQAGFGWILVYLEAYPPLARQGVPYDLDRILGSLEAALGEPAFEDERMVVYKLGSGSSAQQ